MTKKIETKALSCTIRLRFSPLFTILDVNGADKKKESTLDNRRDLISQHTGLLNICPRHKMLQMKSGLLTVEMPHLMVEFVKQDAGKQW